MGKIKAFFRNKWVGFTLASILYILWFVLWTGNWWLLLGGIFFCIPAVSVWFNRHKRKWYGYALVLVIFWAAVYQLSNAANNPFMYFRF